MPDPTTAAEVVAYYKGICKSLGLSDLPLEHRLIEGIESYARQRVEAFLERANQRLKQSAQNARQKNETMVAFILEEEAAAIRALEP